MMSSNLENPSAALLARYLRLIEISSDLSSTLDLDMLLHEIVDAAADVTESKAASIILYDDGAKDLYFQASTDLDAPLMTGVSVPLEGSIAGTIFTSKKPMVINDATEDPRHFQGVSEYQIESILGVPMITKDKVIGVLESLNKLEGSFSEDDTELLLALASQAAVAIENARLFQQSDLIAEMVHELRTPLGSIISASHLMMRPEIAQSQVGTLAGTIQREANRLSDMATSFLDLARLESGRSSFKVAEINLREMLEEALELMMSRIEEQGLTLKWQESSIDVMVQADGDKLKQVALNLISNAIKYNRPDGLIIVGTGADDARAWFKVVDTGRGMLPEHLDSLYERFYRVPGSEQVAQGTGLGLSITKKIVEAHGGEIRVASEYGKGTQFRVILPK